VKLEVIRGYYEVIAGGWRWDREVEVIQGYYDVMAGG
jgi:hypothetical protein